jgi:hypothetical protein
MHGSHLPIERLPSGFESLYRAFDEISAGHTPLDREMLLRATAGALVRDRVRATTRDRSRAGRLGEATSAATRPGAPSRRCAVHSLEMGPHITAALHCGSSLPRGFHMQGSCRTRREPAGT